MHKYLDHHPWKIIEKGFHPEFNRISESIFSLGNGRFGQRGNFEEQYSGESLSGNYFGGVYYPDKTRVGWWKNGYPEYFAKVLNACNWLPVHIKVGDEIVDIHTSKVISFDRELDMKTGVLNRSFVIELNNGAVVSANWSRFISMDDDQLAAIQLKLKISNFNGKIRMKSFLDGDVRNEDANYDEFFWEDVKVKNHDGVSSLSMKTRKTGFVVSHGQLNTIESSSTTSFTNTPFVNELQCGEMIEWENTNEDSIDFTKYVCAVSSLMEKADDHFKIIDENLRIAKNLGFEKLKTDQAKYWENKWEWSDITIDGDIAAQQGIRFNIFQLNQTYTGEDARLNIGPKGFTGEKYGGSTYWDTEAYCLPFYLSTSDSHVAKNLVLYRYNQLDKAIENAEKLGFKNGAALYPMVTMNGEECHNEWEITFEEIHRNGAIAHGVFDYIRYSGDKAYLLDNGLDVLVAISRFWAQRVHWSQDKKAYVMLGVTGPNEYENNVNNNWYTNYIARWTIQYTLESITDPTNNSDKLNSLLIRLQFTEEEKQSWKHIIDNIYFPKDEKRNLYLQQDGFLDKEIIPVSSLDPIHKPLVEKWSWDRILRSCYIKQADVLQGMYFFEEDFDKETIERHFDFYEPITVHESSLSPCVHSILAASLGRADKAYEFYLQTARLDLDDYNHDTEDGCHTTSMAGTWMSIVQGFGGMRIGEDKVIFNPFIPKEWDSYRFHVVFRGSRLLVEVNDKECKISHLEGKDIIVVLFDKEHILSQNDILIK